MSISRAGFASYEVECPHCGEEFEVSLWPEYCSVCGEKLEKDKEKSLGRKRAKGKAKRT
jgi:rRNA maturation endonuclease Nob1